MARVNSGHKILVVDDESESAILRAVRRRLEEYFSSTDQLLELAPRMLTPGRADNNLRAVEVSDVRAILRAAWVGG